MDSKTGKLSAGVSNMKREKNLEGMKRERSRRDRPSDKCSSLLDHVKAFQENRPPKPILLRNLSAYTKRSKILEHFNANGPQIVQDAEILHSEQQMNSKCCVLYLTNHEYFEKILEKPGNIDGATAIRAEPFLGLESHKDLHIMGTYAMEVRSLPVNEDDKGEDIYRTVEEVFQQCDNSGIWFYRDEETQKLTGEARILFKTQESMAAAIDIAKQRGWFKDPDNVQQ